jgi:hypothetical protein
MGNQVLGRGLVRFSTFRSGVGDGYVPAGFRDIGNCPAFGLTTENVMLDHYSSQGGLRVKDKSIVIEQNTTGSITCDDINIENVAMFFFGTQSTFTQTTSETAVNESITNVKKGYTYQLGTALSITGVRNVSAVVVAGKTVDVDYSVDLVRGLIKVLPGGTVAEDSTLAVSYMRAAASRKQVISSINEMKGAIQFVANNGEGPNIDYYLPYVKITPNGEYNLISDQDWQTMQFNLEVLTAPGKARIYADGAPY